MNSSLTFPVNRRDAGSNTTLTGTVAVIIFVSDGSVQGTGFVLEWEGNGQPHNAPDSANDFLLDMTGGTQRYPPGDNTQYANYEVSTFIWLPPGGEFPYAYLNLTITPNTGGAFEGSCYDTLRLFYFGPTYSSGLTQESRLCNEHLTTPVLVNNHVIVVGVFVSDHSNVRYGVTFDWNSIDQLPQARSREIETEKIKKL